MPSYAYHGRDAGGGAVSGVLDGATASAVADALFARGVTPVDIRPSGEFKIEFRLNWPGAQRDAVTPVELMLLSRQLHTLLKAGVPIMRALAGLQESVARPALATLLQSLRESLDAGRDLATAIAQFPRVFTPFYVAMVRVGEMTGALEDVFLRLFRHLEFEKFMREQVRSAIRYPAFVVAAMAVALLVVNLWVIPAFARVYKGLHAKLPWMTELLIGFSDFIVASWPVLLAAAAGSVYAARIWVRTPAGRLRWDRARLELPIAGPIVRKATLARFARSFALAVRSGVPIVQAMQVVADTVDNSFVAERILKMREGIERGESVLSTAASAGIFTPAVLQMIAVGEESGALDDLMDEIGQMYQQEVEYELKSLSSQIEPILIVFLGILVLVLALGIFLPIWDLGKAFGRPGA